jgi:hypothetical protein
MAEDGSFLEGTLRALGELGLLGNRLRNLFISLPAVPAWMARLELSQGGGHDRSLRELLFQENDRIPVAGGFICKASFLESVAGMGPFWDDPRGVAIEAYRRLGCDMIVQLVMPKREEDSTSSTMPTNFTRSSETKSYETAEDVVEAINNLQSIPELRHNFEMENATKEFERILLAGQEEMGDMLWMPYTGTACRFMWYSKFGYRPYFLAMMRYPDEVRRLFAHAGEEARLRNAALSQAILRNDLPPYVYFGEDICYNRGPMVPVQLLREIYFPHLRRAMEPLEEAGIDVIWHSDGNILPIVDDLLSCGVDGFQGFQQETGPDLEDLAEMKSRRGRKLILWGSVSVNRTLPFGSVGDVEREVERCIDAAAPGGGFFLAASSPVGPEVPDRNILAMHRHAIRYGAEFRSRPRA